jgi:hypothetical protein
MLDESTQKTDVPGGPGYGTSEFLISVALIVGGVVLIVMGHEEPGAALLAAVGIGYGVSRGLAKR